jgi:hypothetical protein
MLDTTIVNVLRRRNMDERSKRSSPKWQRTVRTVEWLMANLPPESSLQLYGFNTKASAVDEKTSGSWVAATDRPALNSMAASLRKLVPGGGTSLANAFSTAAAILPRPDNILLITDGLPTQGRKKPLKSTVTGKERIKHFERAIIELPKTIPVNTILFPMEGDPVSPVLYWKLAVDSRGSFFTPTRDWP